MALTWRRRLATAVLSLFGLFLLVALPHAGGRGVVRTGRAFLRAEESPLEERRRMFGAAYADGIEAIRRQIPEDGAYLLVDGSPEDEGTTYWVRFDLAPRRAVEGGTLQALQNGRTKVPPDLQWIVVARKDYGAPELLRADG